MLNQRERIACYFPLLQRAKWNTEITCQTDIVNFNKLLNLRGRSRAAEHAFFCALRLEYPDVHSSVAKNRMQS